MTKQSRGEKYTRGTVMSQFIHIPQISKYNCNYYIGYGKDLLYAASDDDMTTMWYLVRGSQEPEFLGYSVASDDEKLNLEWPT